MAKDTEQATGDASKFALPPDGMIILPVRQTVLFPGITLPLAIGRPSSIAAAQEAVRTERMLGVILQTDPSVDDPTPEQLYRVGTAAQILRYLTAGDGTHHVICSGVRRFRVIDFISGFPYLVARIDEVGISEVLTPQIEARVRLLKDRA
jgi:ATP-dependent Lon protease